MLPAVLHVCVFVYRDTHVITRMRSTINQRSNWVKVRAQQLVERRQVFLRWTWQPLVSLMSLRHGWEVVGDWSFLCRWHWSDISWRFDEPWVVRRPREKGSECNWSLTVDCFVCISVLYVLLYMSAGFWNSIYVQIKLDNCLTVLQNTWTTRITT